jgi:hypothetical protein
MRMLSVAFLLSLSVGVSLQAKGAAVEMPCEQAPLSLPYASYGIEMPKQKGWRCIFFIDEAIPPPNHMVYWKKEGKRIELERRVMNNAVSGLWDESRKSESEPDASIRVYSEIFLRDKNVLEKNGAMKMASEDHLGDTKGIIWSKNNEQVVIYFFDHGDKDAQEEEQAQAQAVIYKKGQDKEYLMINTWGCSLQELFLDVLLPATH